MPETPVSRAYATVKDMVVPDAQQAVYSALANVWSETQQETREEVASWLERMGEARMDYVGKEPTNSSEVESLGGMRGTVYGEATGARWLAKILRGDSDKGWLPSWRWGESRG